MAFTKEPTMTWQSLVTQISLTSSKQVKENHISKISREIWVAACQPVGYSERLFTHTTLHKPSPLLSPPTIKIRIQFSLLGAPLLSTTGKQAPSLTSNGTHSDCSWSDPCHGQHALGRHCRAVVFELHKRDNQPVAVP